MKYLLFYLFLFSSLALAADQKTPSAASDTLDSYFSYLDKYPQTLLPIGDATLGEIEIILDKKKMCELQQKTGRKIGVIAEDNYWLWINDAVKFPNGKEGVYGRLLWRQSLTGPTGVAVMAILPNGKIVLNRNFRHATRSWEYELPRGGRNANESIESAAIREVKEETGMLIDQLHLLGQIATDSGITNSVAPVFLARVVAEEESQPDDSEAIAAIVAFSLEELKKGFLDGFLTLKINGETQKIPLRDPFLAFALFQADLRSLLK